MTAHPTVTLLGPQRFDPTLGEVVRSLGLSGPFATVTAGWQEREGDDRELDGHLGGGTINLKLYERAEAAFRRDPDFARAWRRRQEELRQLQELYRLRLAAMKGCLLELLRREGNPRLLEPERDEAARALRTLDARHLRRVADLHREFEQTWRPAERAEVAAGRLAVRAQLARARALCIAGGHVAVLLNRLRLFGLGVAARSLPVLAWSAGAMAVADRVILFHDFPPQGAGNAEVLEVGLGLAPGVVPLPHAGRRLALTDPVRVQALARRFAPSVALPLDRGGRADWNGRYWSAPAGTVALGVSGRLHAVRRWAA